MLSTLSKQISGLEAKRDQTWLILGWEKTLKQRPEDTQICLGHGDWGKVASVVHTLIVLIHIQG